MSIEVIEQSSGLAVNILLVEDDNGDAKAFMRAFKTHKIRNPIIRAINGEEALAMLRGEGDYAQIQSPYMIISDINMPRMNGIDLINEIREDAHLKKSIIFMLTTSKGEGDIYLSYRQKVAGYICKDNVGKDFSNLVTLFKNYWKVVELPDEPI